MSEDKERTYTPEELRRLNADPEFQRRVGADGDLSRHLTERSTERAVEDAETALGLGGAFRLGGVDFPPPVTATLSLLEVIGSPFVGEPEGLKTLARMDVARALYVLKFRELAVKGLAEAKRLQITLDRLEATVTDKPETLQVYLAYCERQADAWGPFDQAVSKFEATLGVYDFRELANWLLRYLSMAGGFELLDTPPGADKKKAAMTSGGSPG